ncbi:hypothetical protein O9929_15430 [Vibrio lentus]|nr:hypothetical protein [Vibrio lentus]
MEPYFPTQFAVSKSSSLPLPANQSNKTGKIIAQLVLICLLFELQSQSELLARDLFDGKGKSLLHHGKYNSPTAELETWWVKSLF